jgi:hypothetical protein
MWAQYGPSGERWRCGAVNGGEDAGQDMGVSCPRPFDHLEAVGAEVQEQHAGADAAQEAEIPHPLAGAAGPESGVKDRMGAALAQVDGPDLGKPLASRSLCRRPGNILHDPVDHHKPQAEPEGSRRLASGRHRRWNKATTGR